MDHQITLVLLRPDGSTGTSSQPGSNTGQLTDAELLASAERAALADAPAGTRVIRQRLTR